MGVLVTTIAGHSEWNQAVRHHQHVPPEEGNDRCGPREVLALVFAAVEAASGRGVHDQEDLGTEPRPDGHVGSAVDAAARRRAARPESRHDAPLLMRHAKSWKTWLAVAGASVGVAVGAAGPAGAAAWVQRSPVSAATEQQVGGGSSVDLSRSGRVRSLAGDGTPVIDDGRVWWIGLGANGLRDARVYSRSLAGGSLRRVVLDGTGLQSPGSAYQDVGGVIGLSDGRVVVAGPWTADPQLTDEPVSSVGVIAVFDGRTGKLVSQRQVAADTLAERNDPVGGAPLTLPVPQPTPLSSVPTAEWALSDPVTGAVLPSRGGEVAGEHVLGSTVLGSKIGADRMPSFQAVVRQRTSRVERYRVRAGSVARRARAGRPHVWFSVQRNGSLRTTVDGIRGVRPVAVDGAGRIRALGRFQRYARSATVLIGRTRSFVALLGNPNAKRASRRCSGVWIVSNTGKRGRQLTMPRSRIGRQGAPISWDDRYAVWSLSADDPKGQLPYDDHRVRVERSLGKLRLSSRDLPRCTTARG